MDIFDRIRAFPGDVGFYFRRLDGAEAPLMHNPDLPLVAASVIKVPIMVAAFRDAALGAMRQKTKPNISQPSWRIGKPKALKALKMRKT